VTPEEQAAMDASQEKQIRELAAQIGQMSKLGFDPMTIRKGIIAAVSDTTSPPTVALNISGDTETLIDQVRTLNNYTPIVGQTVLVAKQGTEIFLLGAISAASPFNVGAFGGSDNGWQQATLTNGSHGGNSNGNIYYRRVLDHGSWKMQWRGGWSPGGATTMIGSANALDTDFRPGSLRSLLCARDATGSVAVKLDFQADGQVVMIGGTTGPSLSIPSVSMNYSGGTDGQLFGYQSLAGSDLGHYHGCSGTTAGHSHVGATSTVTAPTWVSLNGIEYFL
jgi:hypothetical protein